MLLLGFALACGGSSEGGVEVPNQMSNEDHTHANALLKPGEQIRAYYDSTISLDGTEVAIITDQRVIYVLDGNVTDLPLSEVTEVADTKDAIGGDDIDIKGSAGQRLRVEIAPMNDGQVFVDILREATGK